MEPAIAPALAALVLTSCASRIELPGSMLAPVEAPVAVVGMGPPEDWRPVDAATGQIAGVAGLQERAGHLRDSSAARLRLLNPLLRKTNRSSC